MRQGSGLVLRLLVLYRAAVYSNSRSRITPSMLCVAFACLNKTSEIVGNQCNSFCLGCLRAPPACHEGEIAAGLRPLIVCSTERYAMKYKETNVTVFGAPYASCSFMIDPFGGTTGR